MTYFHLAVIGLGLFLILYGCYIARLAWRDRNYDALAFRLLAVGVVMFVTTVLILRF